MKVVGIVCEYNPFHNGHARQFQKVRALLGEDTAIVCLMSGNFVQRGAPAIFDKSLRAKAALLCGADLVLELPASVSLSSAEGFAAGGVQILSTLCDFLCFGAEDPSPDNLMALADALLSPAFSEKLKDAISSGCSFPVARQLALESMGLDVSSLAKPNNILGVEYCKAILAQNSGMKALPIIREGSYHDTTPYKDAPSATALRNLLENGSDIGSFVPKTASAVFENAAVHTIAAGERAMLARLRTMTDDEFEALPFGSEGLWRKVMHACRTESNLEAILTAAKSKRYTRSRLDRMVMCAFLGLAAQDLDAPAPYIRILGFNNNGREILKNAKDYILLRNAGEKTADPYQKTENRLGSLYGLFSCGTPDAPDAEAKRRIVYAGGADS